MCVVQEPGAGLERERVMVTGKCSQNTGSVLASHWSLRATLPSDWPTRAHVPSPMWAIMERKLRAAWSSPGHLHHPGNNSVPGSHHRNLLPPRAITEELKAITILCVNFSGNKKTISPVISVSFVKRERWHLGEFSLPLSFVIRGSVRFLCPRNMFIVLISRAARARAPGDIIAMQCCAQMLSYKKLHYNDPLVMIKVNDSNKRQKEVE